MVINNNKVGFSGLRFLLCFFKILLLDINTWFIYY